MTLYINCCVREESRTKRLAKAVLHKLGGDFTELNLYEENLKPLDRETLNRRTALIEKGDYSDPMFDYAKQFANADTIVIAAPYWDLSFPSTLKIYIENIYVTGIVSAYDESGMPVGLCKARSFTTSPPRAVPMPRPTATAISRALPRTSSAFRKRIWLKPKCLTSSATTRKRF